MFIFPAFLRQGRRSVDGVSPNRPAAVALYMRLCRRFCQTTHQEWYASTFLPPECDEDRKRLALLQANVEQARCPRPRSTYAKPMSAKERIDCQGNVCCTKCGAFKKPESFAVRSSSVVGRQSWCKVCCCDWTRHNNGFTLRRLVTQILGDARRCALRRSEKPFREEAGDFLLDHDDLLDQWLQQEGRCAYSDVVLSVERHTPFRLSLERRNNTLGYTKANTVFICSEFNTMDQSVRTTRTVEGSAQWSRQKVQSLPQLIRSSTALDDSELDAVFSIAPKAKKPHRRAPRHAAANGDILCASCGYFKAPMDFYRREKSTDGKQSYCKSCQLLHACEYEGEPSLFLRRLWRSARSAALQRTEKGRITAGEFRLEYDDVVEMYRQQRGLCFYSGVLMSLQPYTDWKCSIERIDNTEGYIPGNVALIGSEFQTCDYSLRANIPVKGSPQWSKDKVEAMVQWLVSRKPNVCGGVGVFMW